MSVSGGVKFSALEKLGIFQKVFRGPGDSVLPRGRQRTTNHTNLTNEAQKERAMQFLIGFFPDSLDSCDSWFLLPFGIALVERNKKPATLGAGLRMVGRCPVVPRVRARGVEPPRPFGHKNLNLARLPIPPRPQRLDVIDDDAPVGQGVRPAGKKLRNCPRRRRMFPAAFHASHISFRRVFWPCKNLPQAAGRFRSACWDC